MSAHFRINQPKIIHENIDGEVVVINLDSGTYYSLTDCAGQIWEWIHAGTDLDGITSSLCREYAVEMESARQEAERFLQELQSESLIAPAAGLPKANLATVSPARQSRQPFQVPRIQKFTDMQELLLLDPIHEVDEAGWPRIKSES